MGAAEETWLDEEAAPLPALRPAEVASRYLLLERIGAGAMGVVHRAFDPMLQREVAVKLLGAEAGSGARMLREGQLLARLSHPNVVVIHDVGWDDGRGFLAMELVRGKSLDRWLRDARPDRAAILAAFLQAARGLAAAHRLGIVHRDFKPSNVLVGEDGQVRVADFGIARMLDQPELVVGRAVSGVEHFPLESRLTRTGAAIGTPAYMAPEQAAGEAVDERCDQYAFCVSLREALGPVAPRSVRRILERGTRRAPGDRFASMEELVAALERRRPSRVGRVALVLLLLLAAALPTRSPAAEAERTLSELLSVYAESMARGADDPKLAGVHLGLAGAYRRKGELERARFHADECMRVSLARFGPRHAMLVRARSERGAIAMRMGELDLARRLFHESIELGESLGGAHHADLVDPLMYLAIIAKDAGELVRAETLLVRALAIEGGDDRRRALLLNQLSTVERRQTRYAEARTHLEEAIGLQTRALGPDHVEVAGGILNLGNLYLDEGDLAGADTAYRRSLAAMTRALGADHVHLGIPLMNLGIVAMERGRFAEARAWLDRSLAVRRAGLGEKHELVSQTLVMLGDVRFREGDLAGSLDACTRAADAELSPRTRAQTDVCLGRAHLAAGDLPNARLHIEAAFATYGTAEGDPELVGEINDLRGRLR